MLKQKIFLEKKRPLKHEQQEALTNKRIEPKKLY